MRVNDVPSGSQVKFLPPENFLAIIRLGHSYTRCRDAYGPMYDFLVDLQAKQVFDWLDKPVAGEFAQNLIIFVKEKANARKEIAG